MKPSQPASPPRPVARCSRCKAITAQPALINTTCGHRLSSGFCRGVLRGALRPSDWIKCPNCEGAPHASGHCDVCDGSGWLFASTLGSPVVSVTTAANPVRAELLFHAEGLRGLAGRTRALARTVSGEAEHRRLLRHAVELDEHARRLELEAVH